MGFDYAPKAGKVYVVTLTAASTWYPVLTPTQAKGIRGFKIKSRQTYNSIGAPTLGQRPFDYAFKEAPDAGDSSGDGFYSNSGAGSGDSGGPVNGLWARSTVAGTIIEVMVYEQSVADDSYVFFLTSLGYADNLGDFQDFGGGGTAYDVLTDTTNFDGILASSNTTVQSALDQLDEYSFPFAPSSSLCVTTSYCLVYENSILKLLVNNAYQQQWPASVTLNNIISGSGNNIISSGGNQLISQ